MSDAKRPRAIDLIPDRSGRTANTHVPPIHQAAPLDRAVTMGAVIEAVEYIDEIRRERDSARAANEGWKRAFCALHDALEDIAAKADLAAAACDNEGRAEGFRVIAAVARDAMHTSDDGGA